MAFVRQKDKNDCGVAALAMLCDVTYEQALHAIEFKRRGMHGGIYASQLREGGMKLGYHTVSTPQNRMKVIQYPSFWSQLPEPTPSDIWYLIPANSLVKIPNREEGLYHWVVWRKEKVYDPAMGVFHPYKYTKTPSSYMEFVKNG
jgi:hypothetical protein